MRWVPIMLAMQRPLLLRALHKMLWTLQRGEAHTDVVSRNLTPAVAIVVAVEWGPLRMALSVAIADCAGAMRLESALLAMAAILRLAHAQVVYIHGSSSYSFHSGTPSTYRMARIL